MQSKMMAMLLAAGLTVAMTGCGSSSSSSNDPGTSSGTTGTTGTTGTSDTNCPTGTTAGTAINSKEVCILPAAISADMTLTNDMYWALSGKVLVEEGATLTINAGTTVLGYAQDAWLGITKGAKIEAAGTAASPIVFTSLADVTGTSGAAGDWGGVFIAGKASANKGVKGYEADPTVEYSAETPDDTDNSGTLQYVVIKNSGYTVTADAELNGLSLGAVGSGTTIDHIAIINGADDGIELWGGTVSLNNVYVYNAGDDSIDWDQGWQGRMQNVYVEQSTLSSEDPRLFECDGKDEDDGGTPNSKGVISNFTLKSASTADGAYFREGTDLVLINGEIIVADNTAKCVNIKNDVTWTEVTDSEEDYTFYAVKCGTTTANTAILTGDDIELHSVTATTEGSTEVNGTISADTSAIDPSTVDSNLAANSYIGAGDPAATTMWYEESWITSNLGSGATATCPSVTTKGTAIDGKTVCYLPSAISADLTLTSDLYWGLQSKVLVEEGVTLTINAGTTVVGYAQDAWIGITKGAKIEAEGTAASPIVFTSLADVAGGSGAAGDWGGVFIAGKASANKGVKGYEADPTVEYSAETPDDTDNSGTLQYVVIKNSGYTVTADAELNGLSLGAVGSGTTIENIAIINGADDGIELWGGTVSLRYVYVYNAGDDSIDWDQGWSGTMQNVYVEQSTLSSEDPRLFECDGKSEDDAGTPNSKGVIANFTLKSASTADGAYFREGTDLVLINGEITVADTTQKCINIKNDVTWTQVTDSEETDTFYAIQCNGAALTGDDIELHSITLTTAGSSEVNGTISADTTAIDPSTIDGNLSAESYIGAAASGSVWYEESWITNNK